MPQFNPRDADDRQFATMRGNPDTGIAALDVELTALGHNGTGRPTRSLRLTYPADRGRNEDSPAGAG